GGRGPGRRGRRGRRGRAGGRGRLGGLGGRGVPRTVAAGQGGRDPARAQRQHGEQREQQRRPAVPPAGLLRARRVRQRGRARLGRRWRGGGGLLLPRPGERGEPGVPARRDGGERVTGLGRGRPVLGRAAQQPHDHVDDRALLLRRPHLLGGDLVQQGVGVVVQPE